MTDAELAKLETQVLIGAATSEQITVYRQERGRREATPEYQASLAKAEAEVGALLAYPAAVPDLHLALNGPQDWALGQLAPNHTVTMAWGRGVGKSWWARQQLWLLVALLDGKLRSEAPEPYRRATLAPLRGIRIVALCDTLVHFKDIHKRLILEELDSAGPWGFLGATVNKQTLEIRFPGGSWFQPFPAAEATAKKVRGLRGDIAFVEECDDVDIAVYNSVLVPCFSEPWSLKMAILGGTPTRGRYGLLYDRFKRGQDDTDEHHHSLHATCYDAPETVDLEFVKQVERTTPAETFKREWLCDFDSAEGLVYPLFKDDFHIREAGDSRLYSEIIVGVDWGFEDPGVFVVIGITGHGLDAKAHQFEEHVHQHMTIGEWVPIAQGVKRRFPRAKWWADPSQPANIKMLRTHASINIVSADNAIQDGIASVADKLFIRGTMNSQWSRYYVDPACGHTISEFHEYRRKKDPLTKDRFLEDIVDRNNHCMDALRYAIFGRFGLPPRIRQEWVGGVAA